MKPALTDPLYVIFEQHLFNFPDPEVDRKTLITTIVSDYLSYLRKQNITVPRSLEQPVMEELCTQVNTMLVKKMYGFLNVSDFQEGLPKPDRKRAKTRYSRMKRKAAG